MNKYQRDVEKSSYGIKLWLMMQSLLTKRLFLDSQIKLITWFFSDKKYQLEKKLYHLGKLSIAKKTSKKTFSKRK